MPRETKLEKKIFQRKLDFLSSKIVAEYQQKNYPSDTFKIVHDGLLCLIKTKMA